MKKRALLLPTSYSLKCNSRNCTWMCELSNTRLRIFHSFSHSPRIQFQHDDIENKERTALHHALHPERSYTSVIKQFNDLVWPTCLYIASVFRRAVSLDLVLRSLLAVNSRQTLFPQRDPTTCRIELQFVERLKLRREVCDLPHLKWHTACNPRRCQRGKEIDVQVTSTVSGMCSW